MGDPGDSIRMWAKEPMAIEITKPGRIKLRGMPITLNVYDGAGTITNKYFRSFQMPEFEKVYLPDSVRPFTDTD